MIAQTGLVLVSGLVFFFTFSDSYEKLSVDRITNG